MEHETVKKEYEISFILENEEVKPAVIKELEKAGALITEDEGMKKIDLAYPIEKHESAIFGFVICELDQANAQTLDSKLKGISGVLRFLILTPPVKKVGQKTQEEEEAKKEEAASQRKVTETKETQGALSNEALEQKLEEILK